MTQITNKSRLFDWAKTCGYPEPFKTVMANGATFLTRKNLIIDGKDEDCNAILPLIKAMIYYNVELLASTGILPPPTYPDIRADHLAIGTNTEDSNGSEEIFVEFKKESLDSHYQLVKYSPATGDIRVIKYNIATKRAEPFSLYGKAKADKDHGYCIWLALIPHLIKSIPSFSVIMNEMHIHLRDVFCGTASDDELAGFMESSLLEASFRVYASMVHTEETKLDVPDDKNPYPGLKPQDIHTGKIGPARGKGIIGDFNVFQWKGSLASTSVAKLPAFDENIISKISFQHLNLSLEEKMMIPSMPKDNVLPQEVTEILSEMNDTWENPPATKVTQILMEGAAGSGKSYDARAIAAALKRPYISYTCTPTDAKEDLIGCLLPFVKDFDVDQDSSLSETDKKLYKVITTSEGEEMYDKMAEVLGLPGTTECFYDPEGSYEEITGKAPDGAISSIEVFGKLQEVLSGKIQQILSYSKQNVFAKAGPDYLQSVMQAVTRQLSSVEALLSKAQSFIEEKSSYEQDAADTDAEKKAAYDAAVSNLQVLNSEFQAYVGKEQSIEEFASMWKASPFMAAANLTVPMCMKVISTMPVKSENEKSNVEYKFMPSAITRAVQNGWVLELQEPTCLLQQGALSCLFDVLEKESVGVINTVMGDIKRHPDFICIATMNRKYKGTKPLNEAARSRFQYFQKLETPAEEVIMQRLMSKTTITDSSYLASIAAVFKNLENKAMEINASGAATLRQLYCFADAIKRGKDPDWAKERYLLWGVSTDDDELAQLNHAIEDNELFRMPA